MRPSALALLAIGILLSGCGGAAEGPGAGQKSPGRYAGIGTYDAGRLWGHMASIKAPSDPAAARIEDDEHVIVVVDSHTGEVRQCGDYSGVCIAMNPWAGGSANGTPIKLTKHAADLADEDQANANATPAAEETGPAQ